MACEVLKKERGGYEIVVFLLCPLVKKHADLSGSFLYSQSMMKDMYSKPTNRTELSIPMKTKSIA